MKGQIPKPLLKHAHTSLKPVDRGEDGLEKGLQGQGLDLKNHMTDCHLKKVFKSFFGLFP